MIRPLLQKNNVVHCDGASFDVVPHCDHLVAVNSHDREIPAIYAVDIIKEWFYSD